MRHKDERIKMMNEVLNGMKVLKLYAWEPPMEAHIGEIREKEVNILKKIAYLNAGRDAAMRSPSIRLFIVSTLTWASAPFLVAVASFAAFVLTSDKNVLTPEKTFVSLALFNILRFPMSMLANLVGQSVQLSVSNKRLKQFLAADEIDASMVRRLDDEKTKPAAEINDGAFTWDVQVSVTLKGTFFTLNSLQERTTLQDINLTFPRGKIIAVVGSVGSGKSSLLAALLGELHKMRGEVS